jgi:hypothetical protein
MIIHAISQYQSSTPKAKSLPGKPGNNAVSKSAPMDTYESSRTGAQATGIREDLIKAVKKRIGSGFYNSRDVLEDLSNSFAKALQQTIS